MLSSPKGATNDKATIAKKKKKPLPFQHLYCTMIFLKKKKTALPKVFEDVAGRVNWSWAARMTNFYFKLLIARTNIMQQILSAELCHWLPLMLTSKFFGSAVNTHSQRENTFVADELRCQPWSSGLSSKELPALDVRRRRRRRHQHSVLRQSGAGRLSVPAMRPGPSAGDTQLRQSMHSRAAIRRGKASAVLGRCARRQRGRAAAYIRTAGHRGAGDEVEWHEPTYSVNHGQVQGESVALAAERSQC